MVTLNENQFKSKESEWNHERREMKKKILLKRLELD